MKLTFLGTGAADWKLHKHRDLPDFRRYSSVMIDDCLLIDPGPNVPDALQAFGKNADAIRYVLNTHPHGDHYSEDTLASLKNATFYPLLAEDVQTVGKYTVSALRANHSTCKHAVHFLITDGEKTLFYGLDGAWLMYDEVAAIKKNGVDLAVLDATVGHQPGDYRIFEHNNLNMVVEMKTSLAPYVKRWVISHMARTLHTDHNTLVEDMKPHQIEVAFDGWETEL